MEYTYSVGEKVMWAEINHKGEIVEQRDDVSGEWYMVTLENGGTRRLSGDQLEPA